jgi:hypothetical protein
MSHRSWLLGACVASALVLGCADETMPSDVGNLAGQGAVPAPAVPTPAGGAGAVAPTAGQTSAPSAGSTAAPVAGTTALPAAGSMAMPVAGGAAMPTEPTPPDGEWTLLMDESWTLEPGGEAPQWCGELTLTEDIFVSAIRPIHPPGTHHTTLSVTEDPVQCSTSAVLQNGIIYAAGVGSEMLRMPAGVAMRLPAGQVLHLGLHLYNTSDQPLHGVSGVEVIRVEPQDVEHEAELMLSGPLRLTIPPGRQVITHECEVTEDQTVFAIFPHMHQLGVHMKTTATIDGQATVVHDAEYDFEEQYQLPIGPYDLGVGDTITTECTYQNPGTSNVGFGESSDTEMCFSIFFRYPATGDSFCGSLRP